MFFAWLYRQTKSIIVPILWHGLIFDLGLIVVFGAVLRGMRHLWSYVDRHLHRACFFRFPALLGLWLGSGRSPRPAATPPTSAGSGLRWLGLILTGRWWMRFLRRVDSDEPKPLTPTRRGFADGKGGVRLEWEQFGPDDAPTLLLSHGWSLTHDTWYYQKKALAGEFRVIVWDMRGTGRSRRARRRGLFDGNRRR